MKIPRLAPVLFCLMLGCCGQAPAQEFLTLENYLSRVESANSDIRAADLAYVSLGQKVLELDMVYSPFLSANYSYTDDKSGPGFGSTLASAETIVRSWNVNATQKFATGTILGLGYGSSAARFDLFSPYTFAGRTVTDFTGYELRPFVRLDQSLLRDFMAGLTRAGISKAKAAARAGQYLQLFKRQQVLFKARAAYWTLSLTQDVVAFRRSSLARTEKLLRWNEQRVRLDLADIGDLYQAQAAYKLRQLNLQQAQEDEVTANRDANELLGTGGDALDHDLEKLSGRASAYENVTRLAKTGSRADVLASRASFAGSRWAKEETYFRSLPELSLSATYSLHGLDLQYSSAWDQVAQFKQPTTTAVLSLIVPLDFSTLAKVRQGYENDYLSSQAALRQAELAAERDWQNLIRSWKDVKSRLTLAQEIRAIQEARVANEQKRFERGRSTTFQLLTAENDLDDALLNVHRLVLEEMLIAARAELFNTQPLAAED